MRRRNVLIGLGATAAGGAAVFGSGAFTQLQADRDFTISVAGDGDAFLQLREAEDGDPVEDGIVWGETDAIGYDANNALFVDMDEMGDGEGVNVDAVATLGRLQDITDTTSDIEEAAFAMENQHDDELDIALQSVEGNDTDILDILYTEDGTATETWGEGESIGLGSGDIASFVLHLDTDDEVDNAVEEITIFADT